jgi:hypothetical protein
MSMTIRIGSEPGRLGPVPLEGLLEAPPPGLLGDGSGLGEAWTGTVVAPTGDLPGSAVPGLGPGLGSVEPDPLGRFDGVPAGAVTCTLMVFTAAPALLSETLRVTV